MTDKTTGQAIKMLFTSRKFLIALWTVILNAVLFFGAKYLAPSTFEDVKFLMASIDSLAFIAIAMIAVDNRTESKERMAQAQMQLGLAAPCPDDERGTGPAS